VLRGRGATPLKVRQKGSGDRSNGGVPGQETSAKRRAESRSARARSSSSLTAGTCPDPAGARTAAGGSVGLRWRIARTGPLPEHGNFAHLMRFAAV
jgi:hypothetical protein